MGMLDEVAVVKLNSSVSSLDTIAKLAIHVGNLAVPPTRLYVAGRSLGCRLSQYNWSGTGNRRIVNSGLLVEILIVSGLAVPIRIVPELAAPVRIAPIRIRSSLINHTTIDLRGAVLRLSVGSDLRLRIT